MHGTREWDMAGIGFDSIVLCALGFMALRLVTKAVRHDLGRSERRRIGSRLAPQPLGAARHSGTAKVRFAHRLSQTAPSKAPAGTSRSTTESSI